MACRTHSVIILRDKSELPELYVYNIAPMFTPAYMCNVFCTFLYLPAYPYVNCLRSVDHLVKIIMMTMM